RRYGAWASTVGNPSGNVTGRRTLMRRTCQVICGLYKMASSTPRAADGVITGYEIRSTDSSGRENSAYSLQTLIETVGGEIILCVSDDKRFSDFLNDSSLVVITAIPDD